MTVNVYTLGHLTRKTVNIDDIFTRRDSMYTLYIRYFHYNHRFRTIETTL